MQSVSQIIVIIFNITPSYLFNKHLLSFYDVKGKSAVQQHNNTVVIEMDRILPLGVCMLMLVRETDNTYTSMYYTTSFISDK